MSLLLWILLFSVIGGLLSVSLAALFLLLPRLHQDRLLPHLVSFATGALLGAAFIGLLPEAIEGAGPHVHQVLMTTLAGVMGFFLLEKMVLWRHCHSAGCEAHDPAELGVAASGRPQSAAGVLIAIGDGIHNMLDGVLIAAAFLTDFHLGVVTALAVTAHEIPQELGDFAILLHSGFSNAAALALNLASSTTTVIGAVVAYFSLESAQGWQPYVLAVAAASFIYIAVADLIPGLHRRVDVRGTVQQLVLIGLGILLIVVAHRTLY